MSLWAIVVIATLLFLWYLSYTASRLDRLHHRVETSWASLDALLQQRAAMALEVSHLSDIDPATSMILTQSAYLARESEPTERSQAEESLVAALDFLYASNEFPSNYPDLSEKIQNINRRIELAIEFHRESVHATRNQRARVLVRLFRLAGRAPIPVTQPFEELTP
jgi:hypothetical protein